jgi:hypothetical protein
MSRSTEQERTDGAVCAWFVGAFEGEGGGGEAEEGCYCGHSGASYPLDIKLCDLRNSGKDSHYGVPAHRQSTEMESRDKGRAGPQRRIRVNAGTDLASGAGQKRSSAPGVSVGELLEVSLQKRLHSADRG